MAASSTTVAVNSHHIFGRHQIVTGQITVGAGDYAANGISLDLSLVTEIKSSQLPLFAIVEGKDGGPAATIHLYRIINGASLSACLLKIFVGSSGLEVAAGAMPAAVVADTIKFMLLFPALR